MGQVKEKEEAKNLDLIRKVKNGDENAFNEFYKNNINLVYEMVNKYINLNKGNPMLLGKEDLFQEASNVMFETIKKFDEDLGFKFTTLYYYKCRGRFYRLYTKYVKMQPNIDSLNEKAFDDSNTEMIENVVSNDSEKDFLQVESDADLEKIKKDLGKILRPNELYVIKSLVLEGKGSNEVKDDLKISRQRVSQLYVKAVNKIKKNAKNLEIFNRD